jgi:hypothetical protein
MMAWPIARRRAALGLSPAVAPVAVYVPLGFLVGPAALNVLSANVLAHLDAGISVALATLGVFIGLALASVRRASSHLLAAATIESTVTVALVASSLVILLVRWDAPLAWPAAAVGLALAACAAASAGGAATEDSHDTQASHIADLDDLVPIAIAALLVSGVTAQSVTAGLLGAAAACAIGVAVGAIGWLLFERIDAAGERAVYVIGALAMLGGAAAYLQVSPILAGVACGVFWRLAPGQADAIITEDLKRFHHPLLLLLLIVAGAQTQPSRLALWLFAPFVVFRMSGKLLGGWAASRLVPGAPAEVLGAYLVPPGVVGIAIALNVLQLAPADGAAILCAVSTGAIAFELIAGVVAPWGERTDASRGT